MKGGSATSGRTGARRAHRLAFVATFLGLPLLTFLPIFAQDIFKEGVGQYSQMMAFSGAGAVCGALVVAWLGRFPSMGRTLLLVQIVFGVLIILFSLSRVLWLSHVLLFLEAPRSLSCSRS